MREFILKFDLFVVKALPFWMLFILVNNIVYCEGYNYCYGDAEKTLCGSNQHFMCHDDQLPRGEGKYISSLPMTKKIQSLILDKHNEIRNKIASGNEIGKGDAKFPPAARMREMLWDEELEYLAKRHSELCFLNHFGCISTKRFPYSGQILQKGDLSKATRMEEFINNTFNNMYNEKDKLEHPAELPKAYLATFSESGHFTAMVNELTAFVGCGISFCQQPNQNSRYYILTCNYEFTNLVGNPIYTTGQPASKCSDWNTKKCEGHINLCKNNGKFYVFKE